MGDGPALAALAELPEGLRKELRQAFSGATAAAAAKGVEEDDAKEAAAAESGSEDEGDKPVPAWKRRQQLRSVTEPREDKEDKQDTDTGVPAAEVSAAAPASDG